MSRHAPLERRRRVEIDGDIAVKQRRDRGRDPPHPSRSKPLQLVRRTARERRAEQRNVAALAARRAAKVQLPRLCAPPRRVTRGQPPRLKLSQSLWRLVRRRPPLAMDPMARRGVGAGRGAEVWVAQRGVACSQRGGVKREGAEVGVAQRGVAERV